MLQWFSRTPKQSSPSYSLLRATPSCGLPQELADQEASPEYQEWRDRIECDLTAQRCDEDEPNFLTFLKSGNGLLQMLLPSFSRLFKQDPVRSSLEYQQLWLPDCSGSSLNEIACAFCGSCSDDGPSRTFWS